MLGALTRERFFSRVSPEPNTGCWLWTGSVDGGGYGTMGVNGRDMKATHVSLAIATGHVPKLRALHKCDFPPCVNPDHLFEGTQRDNMLDASRKGRASGPRRLSLAQVEEARTMLAAGRTQDEVAHRFGVSPSTIGHIHRGTTWRNKGRMPSPQRSLLAKAR